jgi:hypothetical protein
MIVVRWIRAFVDFWIDFIIGDDWTVAGTVPTTGPSPPPSRWRSWRPGD